MNNNELNSHQQEQQKQAASSLLKEPQHDTEHNSVEAVKKASKNIKHQQRATESLETTTEKTNNHIHEKNVEVHNDATMDSTVDTDGKIWDIKYRHTLDNMIYSNASLENSIRTQDEGLAGFDSRDKTIFSSTDYVFEGIETIHRKESSPHIPDKVFMAQKFRFKNEE